VIKSFITLSPPEASDDSDQPVMRPREPRWLKIYKVIFGLILHLWVVATAVGFITGHLSIESIKLELNKTNDEINQFEHFQGNLFIISTCVHTS